MDKIKEHIINLLQEGKELPEEYQSYLFPINHKEYELTYSGKVSKQKVLSLSEEPQSIPFQKVKQFGDTNTGWTRMATLPYLYGNLHTMLVKICQKKF